MYKYSKASSITHLNGKKSIFLKPPTKTPTNSQTLDNADEQYACSTAAVVVKQLELVDSSLKSAKKKKYCPVVVTFDG